MPGEISIPIDRERLAAISDRFGVRLAVLYGSHARRRPPPGPESDVDIAVLGCPRDRFWEYFRTLSDIAGHTETDLVRLEDADALFRYEIMQQAVLLYGDPDIFCEYRAFAFRDFTDSADLFALERALFQKKMAHLRAALHDSP